MADEHGQQTSRAAGRQASGRAFATIGAVAIVIVGLIVLDPPNLVLWVKAAHVIAVIAWMAALLYLPRLFVYHCDAKTGSAQSETFKVMERRLLKVIATPAMLAAWLLGIWLVYELYPISGYWIWVKVVAVIGLSAVHGNFARATRLFGEDRNEKSPRHWRMMNEVPTALLVVIVVMVIVKPF